MNYFDYPGQNSLSEVVSAIHQLRADNPYGLRWMEFVDGENLTARAQQLVRDNELDLKEGLYHQRDTFVWLPNVYATEDLSVYNSPHTRLQPHATRAYYYVGVSGDDNKLGSIRENLWKIGFEPKDLKRKDSKTRPRASISLLQLIY